MKIKISVELWSLSLLIITFSLICHRLEEVFMLSLRTADGLSNKVLVIMLWQSPESKVEPWYSEGKDWQNMFSIMRFRCIKGSSPYIFLLLAGRILFVMPRTLLYRDFLNWGSTVTKFYYAVLGNFQTFF